MCSLVWPQGNLAHANRQCKVADAQTYQWQTATANPGDPKKPLLEPLNSWVSWGLKIYLLHICSGESAYDPLASSTCSGLPPHVRQVAAVHPRCHAAAVQIIYTISQLPLYIPYDNYIPLYIPLITYIYIPSMLDFLARKFLAKKTDRTIVLFYHPSSA